MAANGTNDRGEDRSLPAGAKAAGARPIVVERLTHEDVNDVCALFRRVWEGFRNDLPNELIKAWEPSPLEFTSWMEGVTYFAARRDGKLVGVVGASMVDGSCRLVNLVVDPDARRQGFATALTASAIEWAKHNGSRSVWVDALAKFTGAVAVFRNLGFSEAGVLHKHFWDEDVRLLEKLL